VGKDRVAWARADEYLTDLMDSDTMLTLENIDDAIKRAKKYLQRQDSEADTRTAFSSTFDKEDTEHEFKALCAAFKEKDQRLSAKFDSFSHEPREGNSSSTASRTSHVRAILPSSSASFKRKNPTRTECDYCKKTGKLAQGHDESACSYKQRDKADAKLQTIKERHAGKGRQATTSEKKAFAAGAIINKAQPPRQLLAMITILVYLRVRLQSHVTLLSSQRQPHLTSAVFSTAPSHAHSHM